MAFSSAHSAAPPERVWDLIARPGRWHEWSPHVAGAEFLGEPEVEAGARGRVLLRGGLALPATVTAVQTGESWAWEVGGIAVRHAVRPAAGGSEVEMATAGQGPVWGAAAAAYALPVALLVRNIARLAARG